MQKAKLLLTAQDDKAWTFNQLAYAYEQKFAQTNRSDYKETALHYANKVIALNRQQQNKQVAFAYCIKGLIANDVRNYPEAETHFEKALAIYENISLHKSNKQPLKGYKSFAQNHKARQKNHDVQ